MTLVPLLLVGALATKAGAALSNGSLRLNEIQVTGTHNSYHLEASAREKAIRSVLSPSTEPALEYTHLPLEQQLASQGVRQVELDLFADPAGGRYAKPLLRTIAGEGPYDPLMSQPGIKVLHIQDVDYRSNCLTFKQCLQAIKQWSDAHASHVPVQILVQLNDSAFSIPGAPFPIATPVKWDSAQMDNLDAEIASVFSPGDVITPDDVRRGRDTLEEAILDCGWPTLSSSRGKVMFLMDNTGTYRDSYLAGHPSLQGRQVFTNSTPGQPDAAFIKENDPTGANFARIQDEVKKGYIVRTRADVDTVQARTGDTAMRDAAYASGAQMVSTDYPAPGISTRFGTSYVAQLPNGIAARCNPVNSPSQCTNPRRP